MQAKYQLATSTIQKLITAAAVAFLAAMAMVPAVGAMSLVPEGELMSEGGSARSSVSNVVVTRDQIQFLEDNWYFSSPEEVELSAYAADFESMERAPGLHTDPSSAVNPTGEAPGNAGLSHDEMKFLQDNWHFGVTNGGANNSLSAVEPAAGTDESDSPSQNLNDFDAMERAPGLYTDSSNAANPTGGTSGIAGLSHDEIKFLQDNWHLTPDIFLIEDEGDAGPVSGIPTLTQEQIQFAEDNWNFSTGGPLSSSRGTTDRADILDGLRNGSDGADANRHDKLSYPWGGFREHDY